MDDSEKTKDELIIELTALRRQVVNIEEREAERREKEEAFDRNEKAFVDLFNATEEIAFLQELDGTIVLANDCTAIFYGISRENIVGRSIYDFIPPDKVESAKNKTRAVIETKKTVRLEGTLGEGVFENSLYPVFDESGRVRRIAVYVRDITIRKQLEAAVHQAEEKYRIIYENAIEGIFQINPQRTFYQRKSGPCPHPRIRLARRSDNFSHQYRASALCRSRRPDPPCRASLRTGCSGELRHRDVEKGWESPLASHQHPNREGQQWKYPLLRRHDA